MQTMVQYSYNLYRRRDKTMTMLKPPATSTAQFTYNHATRHWVAFVSDTNGLGRVYDDAVDQGLTLRSTRTGREIVFVVWDVETADGDLRLWSLRSSDGVYTMTLFND